VRVVKEHLFYDAHRCGIMQAHLSGYTGVQHRAETQSAQCT